MKLWTDLLEVIGLRSRPIVVPARENLLLRRMASEADGAKRTAEIESFRASRRLRAGMPAREQPPASPVRPVGSASQRGPASPRRTSR